MCGIAGVIAPCGERPDPKVLESMTAALDHRGPDGRDAVTIGNVGLGHTRLAIVDPTPAGDQPMGHRDGRWWLVYNGEIYNHRRLRNELPPVPYRGESDTETLLHCLHSWGIDAVRRCNGLFAFAALDLMSRKLWLVRDRWGVKPLYFARHGESVLFASEIGALLAGGVPREPATDALIHALDLGWANGPATPIRSVERVGAGTAVSIDLETLTTDVRTWFDPTDLVDASLAEHLANAGRSAATDMVEDALRESVRCRLMADVPIGTMCSGGIDSSLVTAFATDQGRGVTAFCASIVDEPDQDEGPWAEAVAGHLGADLHVARFTRNDWRGGLVDAVNHYEYPLTHEASVPLAAVAAAAHERGVKVLLSGEGADELFGGYPWLHQYDWSAFYGRDAVVMRTGREVRRKLRLAGLIADHHPEPRKSACASANEYESLAFAAAHDAYRHHRGPRRRLEGKLLSELRVYLPQVLARQDKNTMQHSVETRPPFLDPDVVRLAVNLPIEYRVEPRRKNPLCEISDRLLPPGVSSRKKIGFNFDVRKDLHAANRMFLTDGHLRELLGSSATVWADRLADTRGRQPLLLWTAEIWCRLFLGNESTTTVTEALWAPQKVNG